MTKITIYQVNYEKLHAENVHLLRAYDQKTIFGVAVAAALEIGAYSKAWEIQMPETGDAALEKAFLVANDVAQPDVTFDRELLSSRQSEKGDLYIVEENGRTAAYIAEGSWFDPYHGPTGSLNLCANAGHRQVA